MVTQSDVIQVSEEFFELVNTEFHMRHQGEYGTPVVGGPRYTRVAGAYSPDRIRHIEALIEERERTPIGVPVTAIYSRKDGIVAWQACIDPYDNDVEHVEVRSSHVGMGLDPDVWHTVADRLGT